MAEEEISKTAARQATRARMTRRVLVISTLGAFLALVLIYFIFWPWPDPNTGEIREPAGEEQLAPEGVPQSPPAEQQPAQPQ